MGVAECLSRTVPRADDEALEPVRVAMEYLLGESPARAAELARQWQPCPQRSLDHWETGARSTLDEALARARAIDFPEVDRLAAFLDRSDQGVVLATAHMGDYPHALLRLIASLRGRRVMILRRTAGSEYEAPALAKVRSLGHEIEVVPHGADAARRLVRGLRRGAVTVLLPDLSARWGETLPLRLLGRPVRMVSGPATIATLGRALVVPLTVAGHAGRMTCAVAPLQDCARPARGDRVARLAQSLVDDVGRAIRAHPEQWVHWGDVPEMLEGAADGR